MDLYFAVCSMNVHKRCQKNVANNCGINTKMMADILNEMGISPDKNPRNPVRNFASSKVCAAPAWLPRVLTPVLMSNQHYFCFQYLNPSLMEGNSDLTSSGDSDSKDDKHDEKGTNRCHFLVCVCKSDFSKLYLVADKILDFFD